jgi:3',5'-cyclic AMP phosphodiesterase CpdA
MKKRTLLVLLAVTVLGLIVITIRRQPPKPPLPGVNIQLSRSVTVAAAGDIACDDSTPKADNACHQDETAQLVEQIDPDALLTLGDLQYPRATLDRLQNFYDKSWGKFKHKTYPAAGNHEYELLGGAAGYFDYFNGVGEEAGRAGRRDQGYYSFNLGAWHLIALNSNCREVGGCGRKSAQWRWLKQDLENNEKRCQLLFWHHPRFTSGRHEENGNLQAIWELLDYHRADIVLVGHNHAYERFAKQNAKRQSSPTGIRQFVVGTGGRSHYEKTVERPNAEVYKSGIFGVLKLDLTASDYSWEFVPEKPGFSDQGQDNCA